MNFLEEGWLLLLDVAQMGSLEKNIRSSSDLGNEKAEIRLKVMSEGC